MKIIEKYVFEVGEGLRRVLSELAEVSGHDVSTFERRMVLHCLQICIYPNGGGEKAVPITKQDLDSVDATDEYILRKKIGKIQDEELFSACREIASMPPSASIEDFSGTALYAFLTKRLIRKQPRVKPTRYFKR